jgi:hypothetical protein
MKTHINIASSLPSGERLKRAERAAEINGHDVILLTLIMMMIMTTMMESVIMTLVKENYRIINSVTYRTLLRND